jgi:hypothetical protein
VRGRRAGARFADAFADAFALLACRIVFRPFFRIGPPSRDDPANVPVLGPHHRERPPVQAPDTDEPHFIVVRRDWLETALNEALDPVERGSILVASAVMVKPASHKSFTTEERY